MNVATHNKNVGFFREAVRRLYDTPDGKLVFNALKSSHVDPSCVDKDTHLTYYKLGKADLIKFLFESIDKGGK